MDEYDRIAAWFAATRSEQIGLPEVAAFVQTLPARARILELGCGTGVPISRFILEQGFRLFAIDSSAEMVARFRGSFPRAVAECATILESSLFEITFDAVVAWGVLFHLTPEDQEAVIAKVARCLVPGGGFLFTAAESEGTTSSAMNGVTFHYASLGLDAYRRALESNGLEMVDAHEDAWENFVFVARKRR